MSEQSLRQRFQEAFARKDLPLTGRLALFLGKYYGPIVYVFVGGLTTVLNLAVYYILVNLAHMDPYTSTAIAWFVAVLFAFVTNKIWVFLDPDWSFKHALYQFVTFIAGRLFSFGLEELLMYVGIDLLHFDKNIVKVPIQIIVLIVNYLVSKLITFRQPKKGNGEAEEIQNDPTENNHVSKTE